MTIWHKYPDELPPHPFEDYFVVGRLKSDERVPVLRVFKSNSTLRFEEEKWLDIFFWAQHPKNKEEADEFCKAWKPYKNKNEPLLWCLEIP